MDSGRVESQVSGATPLAARPSMAEAFGRTGTEGIDFSKVITSQTKAHQDDLERMENLEHRFHILEKELGKETKGVAETLVLMFFDLLRSIPLMSLCAILPTLFGARKMLDEVQVAKNWNDYEFLVPYLLNAYFADYPLINATTLSFAALVACGFSVVAAFPATGATREYIFGHQAHGSCMWCLQTLAGPCIFAIVGAGLAACFVALFYLMVDRMLSGFSVVWIMEGQCIAGQSSRDGVAEALAYFMHERNASVMENRLDKFCKHFGGAKEDFRTFDYRVSQFLTGAILIVLGLVWQLSMHATNYEKVAMEEDLDEAAERDAIQAYYAHHGHHYGAA